MVFLLSEYPQVTRLQKPACLSWTRHVVIVRHESDDVFAPSFKCIYYSLVSVMDEMEKKLVQGHGNGCLFLYMPNSGMEF